MPAIPSDNRQHIFRAAHDHETIKKFDPHPDVRNGGRWVKIHVDSDVPDWAIDNLADELREDGYHVSVIGNVIKVTKQNVEWPSVSVH